LIEQVGVIGLGYVGLPLAVAAANSGFQVLGIDTNDDKIENIINGTLSIDGVRQEELVQLFQSRKLNVSTEYKLLEKSEIVVICVPTPLTENHKPDLEFVLNATGELAKHIKKDTLIILESTVSPGTTREVLAPLIEQNSDLTCDDYFLAFSPERIDPANSIWGIRNTPKLVAGTTPEATIRARSFYSRFIDNVIVCESLEIAETAKLLENSFRLLNIAFINELSSFCSSLGIDIAKVIEAASTKPYGFMPFYPSLGAGGHCIPVDPIYLTSKASAINAPIRLLDLAQEINAQSPKKFLERLNSKVGSFSGKRILVIGISYKANVADVRESPSLVLIKELRKNGAIVKWHDSLVGRWNNENSVNIGADFDFAILCVKHDNADLSQLKGIDIYDSQSSIL